MKRCGKGKRIGKCVKPKPIDKEGSINVNKKRELIGNY
jgi:hypothetical protein